MSKESPLDLFRTSSKKKSAETKPAQVRNGTEKLKPPHKQPTSSKNKRSPEAEEAYEILEKIDQMNKDLSHKIEEAAKSTGKSMEEIEAFIESNTEVSAVEKQMLKKFQKEFVDKITNVAAGKDSEGSQVKKSKPKKRATGDLHTKSIGAKKKWMPVK